MTIDPALAVACLRGYITTDPGIVDPEHFWTGLPVKLLVVRNSTIVNGVSVPSYGKMDDDWLLFDDEALLWSGKGNADPGRTGLNKVLKLDYARLREGVWVEVPGTHKGRADQFVQPREWQAGDLGLPLWFKPDDVHERYLGHCTIDRMKDATTVSRSGTGRYGINCHNSGSNRDDKTGSAGCLTLRDRDYGPFRDAAYAAMGTETGAPRQRWLPVVVARGPLG